MKPDCPLQIVTTCIRRDLPILGITVRQLRKNVPCKDIFVIAPGRECATIQARLGKAVKVMAEESFLPGVTLAALERLAVPCFPQAAGWYYQQLLKLQFASFDPAEDYCLIWDADTVPLRPMRFFDDEGRMLLTKAKEYHPPYFETYRRLLGAEPNREFSLIAQHMVVQKSVAREMLQRIEQHVAGADSWPWKIMRSLPETGDNLFSEYETYGHYIKAAHPTRIRCVERNWLRDPQQNRGCALPTPADLTALAQKYDYMAFERAAPRWKLWGRRAIRTIRRLLKTV